jgi:hypothetical protein
MMNDTSMMMMPSTTLSVRLIDTSNEQILWQTTSECDFDHVLNSCFIFSSTCDDNEWKEIEKCTREHVKLRIQRDCCMIMECDVDLANLVFCGPNVSISFLFHFVLT